MNAGAVTARVHRFAADFAEALDVDFGTQATGTIGPTTLATIRNTGDAPLTLANVTKQGANKDDFLIEGDECSGATLAASGVHDCSAFRSIADRRSQRIADGAHRRISVVGRDRFDG